MKAVTIKCTAQYLIPNSCPISRSVIITTAVWQFSTARLASVLNANLFGLEPDLAAQLLPSLSPGEVKPQTDSTIYSSQSLSKLQGEHWLL